MFGWFRKRQASPPSGLTSELKAIHDRCVTLFTGTWQDMHRQAAGTTSAEQLAFEIEQFSSTACQWMYVNHPIMKQAPPILLWNIIFVAVLEAGCHPVDLVNKAIDLLRTKYVDSPH